MVYALKTWLEPQPRPRGRVYSGVAGSASGKTRRAVTIPCVGRLPTRLNEEDELDGGQELPGFRFPVVKLFDV